MDERQRQEVLSIFEDMSKAANEETKDLQGKAKGRGARIANTNIGGPTIVVCGKKVMRKVLSALLVKDSRKG